MIFLRIAVRLLTIAVHKEMILETHLFLIQQHLSAINQQLVLMRFNRISTNV